jgi:hypothetical protein
MKSLLDVFGVVACGAVIATLVSCGGGSSSNNSNPSIQSSFTVTALVSDGLVPAAHIDANLKNPWGVAFNPKGFVWVADNGTNVATLFSTAMACRNRWSSRYPMARTVQHRPRASSSTAHKASPSRKTASPASLHSSSRAMAEPSPLGRPPSGRPTHCARSVIFSARRNGTQQGWIQDLIQRRNHNVAAVALANKIARTVWALWAHDREFRADYTATSATA